LRCGELIGVHDARCVEHVDGGALPIKLVLHRWGQKAVERQDKRLRVNDQHTGAVWRPPQVNFVQPQEVALYAAGIQSHNQRDVAQRLIQGEIGLNRLSECVPD